MMLLVFDAARHSPSPAWAVRPFLAHQARGCMSEQEHGRVRHTGAHEAELSPPGALCSDMFLSFVWINILLAFLV